MAAQAPTTGKVTPDFKPIDYVKFFGAGAMAACGTHAVRILRGNGTFLTDQIIARLLPQLMW
jgi:hypothetical protein